MSTPKLHDARLLLGAAGLFLAALLVPVAGATAAQPHASTHNFAITIAKLPPSAKGGAAQCTTSGPTMNCSAPMTINQSGVSLPGTIVDQTDHVNGQLTNTCDIAVSGAMTYSVQVAQPPSGVPPNLHGTFSGTQTCTFTATFGSSSFSGSLTGANTLEYAQGSGTWTTNLSVTVTTGTGTFAGEVGTGTFASTQPMSVSMGSSNSGGGATPSSTTTPSGLNLTAGTVGSPYTVFLGGSNTSGMTLVSGTLPPGLSISGIKISGTPTAAGSYSFRVSEVVDGILQNINATIVIAAGSTSGHFQSNARLAHVTNSAATMRIAFVKGPSPLVVVSPGPRVSAKSDGGLVITAGARTACRATATSAGKTVSLGSGTTHPGNGKLVLVQKLRPRLSSGAWVIHVTCGKKAIAKRITVS